MIKKFTIVINIIMATLLCVSHAYAQSAIPEQQRVYDKFVGEYEINRTIWDNEGNPVYSKGRAVLASPFGGKFLTVTEYDENDELYFLGWHRFNPDTGKNENGGIGYGDDGSISIGNFDDAGKIMRQTTTYRSPKSGEVNRSRGEWRWISPKKNVYQWFHVEADGSSRKGGLYIYTLVE